MNGWMTSFIQTTLSLMCWLGLISMYKSPFITFSCLFLYKNHDIWSIILLVCVIWLIKGNESVTHNNESFLCHFWAMLTIFVRYGFSHDIAVKSVDGALLEFEFLFRQTKMPRAINKVMYSGNMQNNLSLDWNWDEVENVTQSCRWETCMSVIDNFLSRSWVHDSADSDLQTATSSAVRHSLWSAAKHQDKQRI